MSVTIKSWLRTNFYQEGPTSLGRPQALAADTGFYRTRNVEARTTHGIDPFIAIEWDQHHPAPLGRFTEPGALPSDATPWRTN
jgi:hypothetical protein